MYDNHRVGDKKFLGQTILRDYNGPGPKFLVHKDQFYRVVNLIFNIFNVLPVFKLNTNKSVDLDARGVTRIFQRQEATYGTITVASSHSILEGSRGMLPRKNFELRQSRHSESDFGDFLAHFNPAQTLVSLPLHAFTRNY